MKKKNKKKTKSRGFPLVILNPASVGFVTSSDVLKLMGFANRFAYDIRSKYRQFGEIEDIKTQVIMSFCYLITKYRAKPRNGKRPLSVTSYCYRYGKQNAISQLAIMREKERQTTLIDYYINELSMTREKERQTTHIDDSIRELAAPIDVVAKVQRDDLIYEVGKRADGIEKKIIALVQLGKTYGEISGILGISKGMITKRLHALGKRIR